MDIIESLEKESQKTNFLDQNSIIKDYQTSYRSKFLLIKENNKLKIIATEEDYWVSNFHAYIAYCYMCKMKIDTIHILGGGVISFSGSDGDNEHLSPIGTLYIGSKSKGFGELPYQIRSIPYPKEVIFDRSDIPSDPGNKKDGTLFSKEMLILKVCEIG